MTQVYENGLEFEEVVLGTFRVKASVSEIKYVDFKSALKQAREREPQRQTEIIRKLRIEVMRKLGVVLAEVKFYSAVGTALDVFHGIDGWFEIKGEVVTIDLTLNPEKVCHKAHVIFTPEEIEITPAAAARIVRCYSEQTATRRF